MPVWCRRIVIRGQVSFVMILFAANAVVAGAHYRLAIGGRYRLAIEAALVAWCCAALIVWRVQGLLAQAVSAETTKFRSLVDAAPEGIIGVAESGRIQFANAESQRLFQYSESDLVGKPIEILIPDRFARKHVHTRESFIANPKRRNMGSGLEVMARRKDGSEFPADVSLSHIRLVNSTLVISIIRDVTAQRRARDELVEANQKLQLALVQNMRRTEELRQLRQMAEDLQACRSEQEAHQVVARCAAGLFPRYSGALYLGGAPGHSIEAVTTWGPDAGRLAHCFAPNSCTALGSRRPCVANAPGAAGCMHTTSDRGQSSFCVPMLARGEIFGVLHLSGRQSTDLQETVGAPPLEILQAIADQISLSMANLRLREALRLQSICDPLTALYNRRFMDEWLSCELPRSGRTRRPMSVLIADLDHFKRVNDTYGHECGDLVLREVGALLRSSVRESDIACRIGGEEFVLLLSETGLQDAMAIAEKLRGLIGALTVIYQDQPLGPITVSIGVAEYPRHGSSALLLLRAADSALYAAKTAGRNRVVAAVDQECVERELPV